MRLIVDYVSIIELALYRIGLDLIYYFMCSTITAYEGFHNNYEFDFYLFSWFAFFSLIIPFVTIQASDKKWTSYYIMLFLMLFCVVPYTTMIGFVAVNCDYILYAYIYYVLLVMIYFMYYHCSQLLHVSFLSEYNGTLFKCLTVISVIIIIGVFYIYSGTLQLSLETVYELRLKAREYNMGVFAYLLAFSRIVSLLALVYFSSKKNYYMMLLLLVVGVLNFSIDGTKNFLFLYIIAFSVFIVHKIRIKLAFCGLTLLSMIAYMIRGDSYIFEYIFRRMMYLPVLLASYHYELFYDNPDFFSRSLGKYFNYTSDYEYPLTNFVGLIKHNSLAYNANTGLTGDAAGNLGILGVLLMPILIVVVLWFVDLCLEESSRMMKFFVGLYIALIFVDGTFFTLLITHGVILMCVCAFLISNYEKYVYNRELNKTK